MELKEGYVYHIKEDFFNFVQDNRLMKNHEGNSTRPNYFCIKMESEDIMWFIPMSSKVEKYQKIIEEKIIKYKKCDTIVIGNYRGRDHAFLLQNMFPITLKYIDHIDTVQGKAIQVPSETRRIILDKVNKIFKLKDRGINLIFPDVDKIKQLLVGETKLKTIENDLDFLHRKSTVITDFDDNLKCEIDELEEFILNRKYTYALAAIQIGYDNRLIYVKSTSKEFFTNENYSENLVLINPIVLEKEGLTSYWENCASCLDNMGLVLRPYRLKISYQDRIGGTNEIEFKGFPATVISHELDHLDGILHMDIALEVKNMPLEERKKFRESNGYTIINKDGSFEELSKSYMNNKF